MASIADTITVEIEVTPDNLLEAYDGMSKKEQDQILQALEEHFTESQIGGDALERITSQVGQACNLSSYDHQKANQYLARYGWKLLRTI